MDSDENSKINNLFGYQNNKIDKVWETNSILYETIKHIINKAK